MRLRVFAVLGVLTLLAGVLAVGAVNPAEVAAVVLAQDPAPGPVLEPTDQAAADESRNKIILGGIAAVLLAIVIFGRSRRRKKNN
jgi:hypothetical protein